MNNSSKPTPLGLRIGILCLAWTVAFLAMSPDPSSIRIIHLFPIGLFVVFHLDLEEHVALCLGWLFYAGLVTAALAIRQRLPFILIYIILCLFLGVNVYGCQHMRFPGL